MVKELSAFGGLGDSILRGLRQPEYVHVLLNPLPVYGLLIAWIGLLIAFFSKSRRAQIAALVLVLISSLSAWPVYEFGQQGYDRVLSMTDEDGERWLDEHRDRAEDLIWIFYALAVLSAIAIAAPIKWPKSSAPLVISVIFLAAVTLGTGWLHCVRRRQNPASRISHRTSAAEEGGTPGLDRECKARNANVIPSEVEAASSERSPRARLNPVALSNGRITGSFDSAALRSG